VLLVVDASAMARSVAALVHGYATFDPALRVAAVVANRVASDWHEQIVRDALDPLGIPLVGVLRRDDALATPSRHLGLVPVGEREAAARATVDALAAHVRSGLDLPEILRLARSAPPLRSEPWTAEPGRRTTPAGPMVAVATGPAFTFLYEENLELLEAAGAQLAFFDPLHDEALPEGTAALYLGGGFPEARATELSANARLRAEVAAFAASGRPVVAECGGVLYLSRSLDGVPMCGALDADGAMSGGLTLGYREAEALADSPLWSAGERVRGHEFHYSTVTARTRTAAAWRLTARGRTEEEGFAVGGIHASYLHTHWASTPSAATRLVAAAAAPAVAPAAAVHQ
jgi:cobyrinic acid a,c-diamide synthase